MTRSVSHGAGKRGGKWTDFFTVHRALMAVLPLALVAIGCTAAAVALSSCGNDRLGIHPPPPSVAPYGMAPDVRVRLTSAPLTETNIATLGGYCIKAGSQVLGESYGSLPATTVSRVGGIWRVGSFSAQADRVTVESSPTGCLRFNQSFYRGRMHFVAAGPDRFHAVNELDVESYLAGVLAKELYRDWSLSTYRALAVSARTFALYHRTQRSGAEADRDYDLAADQSSQVYGGYSAETDVSRQAVRDTYGQVLTCGPPGQEKIFLAQYSACCGGTVNSAAVMRDAEDIPPLRGGQTDEDCRSCTNFRWAAVRISKTDLYRAVADSYPSAKDLGGSVARIEIVRTTPYGRAIWVDLFGPNGKKVRIRAEDVRVALIKSAIPAARKLYSMNCQIREAGDSFEFYDGRGYGHGVGLCQWGAQGKAQRGWSAERILEFYYPGAKVFRAY